LARAKNVADKKKKKKLCADTRGNAAPALYWHCISYP
jgi:hypothetical protein